MCVPLFSLLKLAVFSRFSLNFLCCRCHIADKSITQLPVNHDDYKNLGILLFYFFGAGAYFNKIELINLLAGNKRLCSQDIEKIRGEDSWTG